MTEPQPSGWYLDPLGHAEQRYWDGERWTDHVATAGVVSTDPLEGSPAPPEDVTTPTSAPSPPAASTAGVLEAGWYLDPLGHAEQRYWDGERWTDHVATAGMASTDPLGGAAAPSGPPPDSVETPTSAKPPSPVGSPDDETSSRRRLVPVLLAGLAVVAIVVGIVMLMGDGDDDDGQTDVVQALLEPAESLGPDPFTPTFAAAPVISIPDDLVPPLATVTTTSTTTDPTTTSASTTTTPSTTAAPSERVNHISSGTPGLYGGTQDNTRCDTTQLVGFLDDNPDKAEAWVDALNNDPTNGWFSSEKILPGDIGDFVDELTPVVLLSDTLVVNNGFSGGRPTPREAVLQKGSAVLVDPFGVPRTRCACGNPLAQPPAGIARVEPQGEPWPGFSTEKIAVVDPAPERISFLRMVDIETGEEFRRPMGSKGERDVPATTTTTTTSTTTSTTSTTTSTTTTTTTVVLGTGDVQATLNWSTTADLDLHVIGPDGVEISWEAPDSPSGGTLDVDRVPFEGDSGPHVENVFWPTGAAPPGDYQVWVVHFSGETSAYSLTIKKGEQVIHEESSTLQPGENSTRFTFAN